MDTKVIIAKVLVKLARKKDKEPTNWEKREELENLSFSDFIAHLKNKPWDALLFDKLDEKVQVELAKEFKGNERIRNMLIGIKNLSEKAFDILEGGQAEDDEEVDRREKEHARAMRMYRTPTKWHDDYKYDKLRRFDRN